jgi:hypothetical protein
MANSENTAVNELIARVSGGPTSSPGAPAPREAASAFPAHAPVSPMTPQDPTALDHAVTLKAGAPMHTARPTSMPVAAPFETQPGMPMSYPVVPRAMIEPADPSVPGVPAAATYGDPGAPPWATPAGGPAWNEPVPLNAPRERSPEHLIGTLRLSRRSDLQIVLSKLVLPMTILLVTGMLIGGYVAFHGDGGLPRSPAAASATGQRSGAPVPVQAAPAAAPVQAAAAALAPTPAAVPTPTTITVEPAIGLGQPLPAASAPSSAALANPAPTANAPVPAMPAATVAPQAPTTPAAAPGPTPAVETPAVPAPPPETAAPSPTATMAATPAALVDVRIDSTPSGATVMLVDRGKAQYVGSTPVSAAVDPSREYDLVFTYPNKPTTLEHLDASTTRRVAVTLGAPAGAAVPADSAPHHLERAEPPPAIRKPARQAAGPGSGEGTLKISSKPPCEIVIDGKSTGLVTPQTSIALPAGSHRVTLVNREKDIKKTVSVQISANTTEKIIEDFMK